MNLSVFPFTPFPCLISDVSALHVKYFACDILSMLSFQVSLLRCPCWAAKSVCAGCPTKSDCLYINLSCNYINCYLSTYSMLITALLLLHVTHTSYYIFSWILVSHWPQKAGNLLWSCLGPINKPTNCCTDVMMCIILSVHWHCMKLCLLSFQWVAHLFFVSSLKYWAFCCCPTFLNDFYS